MRTERPIRPTRTATTVAMTLLLFVATCPATAQSPGSRAVGQPPTQTPAGLATVDSRRLPADIEQVIGWLPEDTESVMLIRGSLPKDAIMGTAARPPAPSRPVSTRVSSADRAAKSGQPTLVLPKSQEPEGDFWKESLKSHIEPHFQLAGEKFGECIANFQIRFIVTGGRRFGLPVIGGASTYEGCDVIVFETPVPDVDARATGRAKLSVLQSARNRIVRIDTGEKWGPQDEPLVIYYAKPKPTVLITATNAGYLATVLERMARPLASRTPLLDFPEWQYVDIGAPVWGVRHRHTTTPFYFVFKGQPGFAEALAKLDGVAFSYQPKPQPSIQLHFHCTDKPENVLPCIFGKQFDIKPVGPEVAEGRAILRSDSASSGCSPSSWALFMMNHLMGYVVCP
jgi:hypothetical protein